MDGLTGEGYSFSMREAVWQLASELDQRHQAKGNHAASVLDLARSIAATPTAPGWPAGRRGVGRRTAERHYPSSPSLGAEGERAPGRVDGGASVGASDAATLRIPDRVRQSTRLAR